MRTRHAATLIEILLAVAILTALIGILIPAVQKLRESAARTQAANNERQIVLGIHGYAAARGEFPKAVRNPTPTNSEGVQLFIVTGPYTEEGFERYLAPGAKNVDVKVFLNPADPTIGPLDPDQPIWFQTSYGCNAWLFARPRKPESVKDGLSNTIAIAGHYATCGGKYITFGLDFSNNEYSSIRRATFAEGGNDMIQHGVAFGSVYPLRVEAVTTERSKRTFQVRPAVDKPNTPMPNVCDSDMAQTPFAAGMLVAMADGSVRLVSPRVDVSVFWGAVTPDWGETLPADW